MSSLRQSLRRTPGCQGPHRRWSIATRFPSANIPQQRGSRARVPPAGELTRSDLWTWQTMEAAGIEPAPDSDRQPPGVGDGRVVPLLALAQRVPDWGLADHSPRVLRVSECFVLGVEGRHRAAHRRAVRVDQLPVEPTVGLVDDLEVDASRRIVAVHQRSLPLTLLSAAHVAV